MCPRSPLCILSCVFAFTFPCGVRADTLFLTAGAELGTTGRLAVDAEREVGNADTIPAADGSNYIGTPHNPIVYEVSGVSGAYNDPESTGFILWLDSGANVANGTQARVSYDFDGDGLFDRLETYPYFATDDTTRWEVYTEAQGPGDFEGEYRDLDDGTVRLELWSAIGRAATQVRTSAGPDAEEPSSIRIPFADMDVKPPVDPNPERFVRGDSNADGSRNLTDAVFTLNYLFLGGNDASCRASADADDNSEINLTDAVYLLNHLFLGGPPPADPFPACGPDPTEDGLGCESFAPCE